MQGIDDFNLPNVGDLIPNHIYVFVIENFIISSYPQVPLVICQGTDDKVVNESVSKELATRNSGNPDLELVIIEGGYHGLETMLQEPSAESSLSPPSLASIVELAYSKRKETTADADNNDSNSSSSTSTTATKSKQKQKKECLVS